MLFTMREMYVDRDPKMAHLVQNINHSAFRSMFEREKLLGNNFNDWFRQLNLVLRVERKLFVIEQPISLALPTDSEYLCSVMRYMIHNEVACLILGIGELHAMLIEYEHGLPKKAKTPQVMMIKGGKIQKAKKKSLIAKGKSKARGKGKDKQVYISKTKYPKPYAKEYPAKYDVCHHCKEVGHWKRNCPVYLAELLKKKKQVGSTSFSNGIYEIDMHDLVPNVNSIYNVSTKRVKHNLDSTYLWHCLLARINMCQDKDYALESATRILNMVPTKKVNKTSYELWYGKVPNLSYLKDTQRKQWVTIFYFPPENKIFVARYAEFFEKNLITQEVSGRAIDLEKIQDEDTSPSEITSEIPMEVEGFEPPQEEVIPVRRSKRTHRAPTHLCLNVEVEEHSLGDLNEPASYKVAMLDSESNKWLDAMNAKMKSMKDNQV
nr:zinc finger, CCHC-type [Tanacetum cinerariifolium]